MSGTPDGFAQARNVPIWQLPIRPSVPEYCLWTPAIGVPRREVQESLERLRLAQAGILGDRLPVLPFQRSKQAPQIPHSMGAGICP